MAASWTLVTPATLEPVSLDELKEFMRIVDSDQDSTLMGYLKASRKRCEDILDQQFCTATWQLNLDSFASWRIDIPRPPLISITSITAVDTAGNSNTIASSLYHVDAQKKPGRLEPAWSKFWPYTRLQSNAVVVTYQAGYGAPADVPETIKTAIKGYAAWMSEHRDETAVVPQFVEDLLASESHGTNVYHGHEGLNYRNLV